MGKNRIENCVYNMIAAQSTVEPERKEGQEEEREKGWREGERMKIKEREGRKIHLNELLLIEKKE